MALNIVLNIKPTILLVASPTLRKVSIKKSIKSYGIFHTGGEGVYPISITFFGEKKCFFHKKYKDDKNGLIHPEN